MANQIKVQVNQAGPSASEGQARNHAITMDRPETKGGKNQGPMGGELLLLGLGGCFMSNLLAAVAARQAAVDNVRLTLTGTLESAPPRYSAVEMIVSADYHDRELMDKLLAIAERGCISANTLRNAVDLSIRLR